MRQRFRELDRIPCVATFPNDTYALWSECLNDVWLPRSMAEWKQTLDSTEGVPKKTLFANFPEEDRNELFNVYKFLPLKLPSTPPISLINQTLPNIFERSLDATHILRQSQIPRELKERTRRAHPDIVVLMVFDGLSYFDAIDWTFPESWSVDCSPCLVDSLSTTQIGMKQAIGSPSVAHHLFELGYRRRMGFSYWERNQNKLTDELFSEFPSLQLFRITTFEEVVDIIADWTLESETFVQIVRTGLDGYCHRHREKPDVSYISERLRLDIIKLGEVLVKKHRSVVIFVASDHGILWFNGQKVLPTGHSARQPRYFDTGIEEIPNSVHLDYGGNSFTVLLGEEVIARPRRTNEWGFHGGISAHESLIPLIEISLY